MRELVSQFLIEKIDGGTESNLEMLVIALLDACYIDYCDNEDTSLLLWSAVRGHRILFNQIVEHCDAAELMGHFGNGNNDTPIMYTMQNGWIEETEKLVNSVDQDTINERYSAKDDEDNDKTILYFAIDALESSTEDEEYNRWVQVIIKILEKGADSNLTYEDSEGIEYNCLTYAISKLWGEDLIKDMPEPDRNLCKCLYKCALRLKNGKDETGIEDNNFYKGDNQADFDEWEQEIKKEFEPKKDPKPKSGKQVKEKNKTKGG